MDIDTLTIKEAREAIARGKEVEAMLGGNAVPTANASNPKFTVGDYVIVRSRDAGVQFGRYAGNDGSTIHLTDAVQMWKWHAAAGGTLIDCAAAGVIKDNCKFSPSQGRLTVFNACALIACTDEATESLKSVSGGKWK